MTTTQEHLKKIESFRNLKYNWDSYNGAPTNPKAIELAKEIVLFLGDLLNDFYFFPVSSGNILFESDTTMFDIRDDNINKYDGEFYIDCWFSVEKDGLEKGVSIEIDTRNLNLTMITLKILLENAGKLNEE